MDDQQNKNPYSTAASQDFVDVVPTGPNANFPVQEFSTGAVRGTDAGDVRYDLISPIALRRIAETYAEGSKKYGDNNWLKGIPSKDLLNHAIRHLMFWQTGDSSEDHLAHAVWNLMAAMHFEEAMPAMIERQYVMPAKH